MRSIFASVFLFLTALAGFPHKSVSEPIAVATAELEMLQGDGGITIIATVIGHGDATVVSSLSVRKLSESGTLHSVQSSEISTKVGSRTQAASLFIGELLVSGVAAEFVLSLNGREIDRSTAHVDLDKE